MLIKPLGTHRVKGQAPVVVLRSNAPGRCGAFPRLPRVKLYTFTVCNNTTYSGILQEHPLESALYQGRNVRAVGHLPINEHRQRIRDIIVLVLASN